MLSRPGRGLRLTNMSAPTVQDPRADMLLLCRFDMGGEELYAVKWYKDDNEFFRYSPGYGNKYSLFPIPGVHVDKTKSACDRHRCDLTLTNLTRPESAGAYRCEISSEAPSFRLASQTRNISVAVLPEAAPKIEISQNSYFLGDTLTAVCTSDWGDPTPTLTFYANGEAVAPKYVKELKPQMHYVNHRIKLVRNVIQMRVPLDRRVLKNHTTSLDVACASTSDVAGSSLASNKFVMLMDKNQLVNNEKLYSDKSRARASHFLASFRLWSCAIIYFTYAH
ncbi:uncharacterized protein LOC132706512 isoform X2 [Cylas formicarius]|uniref:uncharacterized protein LOC132706512 isoform X2 n=1 Tax=Cylas formicarius TaxID=197179 RepID=UPI002958457C|nr:uncharacterized protein LOC132706512 isoform X2 [Cylas formicarius]